MTEKKLRKINRKLLIMFCMLKKKKMYLAYVSKHTSNSEKQFLFLMIPNEEGWHNLAVKNPSALLRGITSKDYGDFYCLNLIHSFATENRRESHKKKYMKIKIFVTL